MKKKFYYLFIFSACFILLGCQSTSENNVEMHTVDKNEQNYDEGVKDNMNQDNFIGFENLGKVPEATEVHPLNEVVTLFFDEWSIDEPYQPVAINVTDNEIYLDASLSLYRYSSYEENVQISDAKEMIDILKKYNVQQWEKDYTFEDPETYVDGYSWKLWLQFEDGTVEKHSGKGTDADKITPENFHAFVKDLTGFVEEKLEGAGS